MKKSILIGIIVVVLIAGGVVAWYFLKGRNNSVVLPTPTPKQSETVIPNSQVPSVSPTGGQSFSDYYGGLTQAQKDCLLKAIGQKKRDALLNNDPNAMQAITGDEYEKLLACPQ